MSPKPLETFSYEQQVQRIGEEIGVSDWVLVTQEMIDQFSAVTLDPDPMHIDRDWCKQNSPFGDTIAFGFLTVSLLTFLVHEVLHYDKHGTANSGGYALNYGFDRLRFTGAVPSGGRIRGRFVLKDVRERAPGELVQTIAVTVEVEGEDEPALIADWLFLWVTEPGHKRILESHNA